MSDWPYDDAPANEHLIGGSEYDQTHYLADGCQPPHMMASEPPVAVRPPVAATPPQGIDREEAWDRFRDGSDYQPTDRYDPRGPFDSGWAAALALVRPVEGVIITPEEAGVALALANNYAGRPVERTYGFMERALALASRLEALS